MSIAVPWTPGPDAGAKSSTRTDVFIKRVADPVIRDTLIAFEANLSPVTAPPAGPMPNRTSWPLDAVVMALSHDLDLSDRATGSAWIVEHRQASQSVADALAAVDEVRDALGVSQQDALKIAGIKKRTYHSWKKGRIGRIRPDSLGRLWELHDLVGDVLEVRGRAGIKHWLAEDGRRLKALAQGDFDGLAEAAARRVKRDGDSTPWPVALQVEEPLLMSVQPLRGISMDADDVVEP